MAPEVHRKRAYGAPVDVFAFGVVLRKLLSRVQAPPSKGSLLRRICLPALYSMTKSSYAFREDFAGADAVVDDLDAGGVDLAFARSLVDA